MESQKLPILFNILAAVLGALGQYAYKKGGQRLGLEPLWTNYNLLIGILLFCGVMVCFVFGYKYGGRISVVYPFYATTFIWGALLGFVLEKEPFHWTLAAGSGLILAGLAVISQGQRM